ncbi:MAG TPA: hypothetical protein VGL34_01555 [Steroidobacteraceae bacterium]|jgi:subtilase family serine protease
MGGRIELNHSYWAELSSPYAFPAGFTAIAGKAPWAVRGNTPAQIKSAYGISGYDGSGQTVAIIDAYASPTILQDVNQWSTNRGLPTMTPAQLVQVVPPGVYKRPQNPKQDPQGWYGGETLDVEAVHGMAPGAKIVYVGAPNNYQDLGAAMNHVVDQHLAQIVTNSYGFPTELASPIFAGLMALADQKAARQARWAIWLTENLGPDDDHLTHAKIQNPAIRSINGPVCSYR